MAPTQPVPIAKWNNKRDVWEKTETPIFGPLDVYSETFPTSGMTVNGVAYELPPWGHRMEGSESLSLLRTVMADEAGGGPLSPAMASARGQTLRLSGQIVDLVNPGQLPQPKLLMTPVASEGTKPSNTMGVARRLETGQVFLTNQIVTLCGLDPSESQLLPTPVAQPSGNTPSDHLRKKPGREVVTDLAIIVENDLLPSGGRMSQPSADGRQLWDDIPLPLPN